MIKDTTIFPVKNSSVHAHPTPQPPQPSLIHKFINKWIIEQLKKSIKTATVACGANATYIVNVQKYLSHFDA